MSENVQMLYISIHILIVYNIYIAHFSFTAHIAFCGELFELCVTFPFHDFLPKTVPVNLVIKVSTQQYVMIIPETF